METLKLIYHKYYSIKLITILLLTMMCSLLFKIYPLSGLVEIGLTLYVLIKSFKNEHFKKKKIGTKIFIYFFILIFLLSGLVLLGGDPNSSTNGMRSELKSNK